MERPESIDIPLDTLSYIILKARAFDAQAGVSDPDEASNDTDDGFVSVLEGQSDDPTAEELADLIDSLSDDERASLVALAWIGRGDYDPEDWEEVRQLARERRQGSTARYLLEMPMLGDYLEEGAAALGINLTDEETDALYHENGGEEPARD
ncbi:MAG: DUF3775 domain-containing protein [Sphingomonadaceae bacterium]|uniref:DUF3775 domain-containing protein n=1 Tax=Thermaurantiacus sp. TaxID=2820283 RepID=UPI00298EDE9F|nr:DUF3775 domain-containing protein [Thermaurantiacus sp.]MCS6986054.1 DUF3775 domain-containing protein [Sphingomonadaceae bacterium]MDW8414730.1 DUF3775 domain-containing protein [Thermaurantiacus sp.]